MQVETPDLLGTYLRIGVLLAESESFSFSIFLFVIVLVSSAALTCLKGSMESCTGVAFVVGCDLG